MHGNAVAISGQKRALNLMELELQAVERHPHAGAGNSGDVEESIECSYHQVFSPVHTQSFDETPEWPIPK